MTIHYVVSILLGAVCGSKESGVFDWSKVNCEKCCKWKPKALIERSSQRQDT